MDAVISVDGSSGSGKVDQDVELAEAVAVIGMSCRFAPDLDSLDKFWAFLADGQSSVGEMPDKRWEPYASSSPQATAIMRQTTRLGAFLDDIEGFDADFFGISPREADYLDPQQRIMLELSWEALAHAGIPPLSLRGTEAGVYVAANSNDYGRRLLEDIPRSGAYAVNGTTYYGIANRLSYFLDLRGPSMAVDTACAGSLTALHLACQSLRLRETSVNIVGGVNIMSTPALFVALDAAGATSPDGRSKAFDKDADGYGRGEGAGVVVLKRLADARRDGDPVLAVILGSGVFQDGRSDGMMAPNSHAQEHMLRQAYDKTGISPGTVDYIEAHGTGTPVGDREEAQALAKVFGRGRPAQDPCLIGSVKPNIGHTEGGSGIAGVIKTVLALQHEKIPPSLHTEPNPNFDWGQSGLRLVGELEPWHPNGHPRRAGVSSYGVGGTIAHLILQEPPAGAPEPAAARPAVQTRPSRPLVYPLSAASEAGLRALAASTADWLDEHPGSSLSSAGHTLSHRRSHLAQRAAVVADSATTLAAGFRAVADGQHAPGVSRSRVSAGQADGVVWVFSGHGAQWSGMGQQLLRDEPVFAAAIDALAPVFRDEMGWTPREAITDGGPWTVSHVQALTFAMQIGLAEVWRSHGVSPSAIIGHSVGEIAAAVEAGSLDVAAAARFACRRARALERLEGLGGMAMVGLPFADVEQRLAGREDVVAAIAASARSTVVSGDKQAVERLAGQWQDEGLEVWHVETDVAFHSAQIDAVLSEVEAAASEMTPSPARVPLYTTALADPRSAAARDGGYWATNLRQPVRFAEAVVAAIEDGHRMFLEVSSHPVVTHSIVETVDHLGVEDATVSLSLRRNTAELSTLLGSLAELHCRGAAIDWSREHPGGELAALPVMEWQHRPYWVFASDTSDGGGTGGGHDPASHNLLGGRMTVSGAPPRQVWQTYLDMSCRPYPQNHEVVGVEITPAAAIVETFVKAAAQDGRVPGLSDIVLRTPLAVTPPRVVQIVLSENLVRLSSRITGEGSTHDDEQQEWITHTTAAVDWAATVPEGSVDVAAVRDRCDSVWTWSRVDDLFRTKGVGGYAFPWDLDEFRRNDDEQLAILTLEPAPAKNSASWAHVIDGALTISAVLVTPEAARRLWMSCAVGSVAFQGEPPARITVHTRRSARSPENTVDVLVADDTGQIVAQVGGLKFAELQDEQGQVAAPRDLVHEVVWRPLAIESAESGAGARRVVVVGDDAARLAGPLEQAGVPCTQVRSAQELEQVPLRDGDAVVVAPAPAQAGEPAEQAAERCGWELISVAKQLSAGEPADGGPRLWCLTQGVRAARDEAALGHAPLWGIGRIIAGERPDLWGGAIDVTDAGAGTGALVAAALRHLPGEEDVISVTADGIEAARLSLVERASERLPLHCLPTGTYLITGGLGALGLATARWLIDHGARRLLLASRRGLPPRAEWDEVSDATTRQQIDGVVALEALGVTVRVLKLDITDAAQVAVALDPAAHGLPPVRGIVHAAGVTNDAMLGNVDRDSLAEVMSPKAAGAMVLHRIFPPGTLDFFVLFSSCGQFARLTGQTSYAAANSFLDGLAAHRHADGHTDTTTIGWTSWQGEGMSGDIATTMLEANARGLGAISAAEAFRAWTFADRFSCPYQAILRVLPLPSHTARPPMFRELAATQADSGETGTQSFAFDPAGVSPEDLAELVTSDVRDQVAAELNLAAEDVEFRRPLVELGVDSVLSVALRVRLGRRYGLDLPPTILWNKPTVAALAGHITDGVRSASTDGAEQDEPAEADSVLSAAAGD